MRPVVSLRRRQIQYIYLMYYFRRLSHNKVTSNGNNQSMHPETLFWRLHLSHLGTITFIDQSIDTNTNRLCILKVHTTTLLVLQCNYSL